MSGRTTIATLSALLLTQTLLAQTPAFVPRTAVPPTPVQQPAPVQQPVEPRLLPPLGQSSAVQLPPAMQQPPALPPTAVDPQYTQPQQQSPLPQPDPTVRLPRREQLLRIDPSTATIRRQIESWQLWAGPVLLRDFGTNGQAAQDALAVIRGMRPTSWGMIGAPVPVVEYGLVGDGEQPKWAITGMRGTPIDLRTVRAEPVRGAWCVRDDDNIVLNFGPSRSDAEQAAAIAKRYGFNRVGSIGPANRPMMSYFYAAPIVNLPKPAADVQFSGLNKVAQEANLTRTGIDVPGVGLVGERWVIESRKMEVRKDRGEWVLASGTDVLGRFGYSEFLARDAQRIVQDANFTEFCRVGGGMTFFLSHGQAPTRVPFAAQGTRFDPARLTVRELSGNWGVYEGTGRLLFPAASREDAELMVKVVQGYKFDQICQVGNSGKSSLRFLARTGR